MCSPVLLSHIEKMVDMRFVVIYLTLAVCNVNRPDRGPVLNELNAGMTSINNTLVLITNVAAPIMDKCLFITFQSHSKLKTKNRFVTRGIKQFVFYSINSSTLFIVFMTRVLIMCLSGMFFSTIDEHWILLTNANNSRLE